MALKILRCEEQVSLEPLRGKTVAVIGYGNQGHAHALNLRESGVKVVVGSRAGSRGGAEAAEHGFEVCEVAEAAGRGDLVIMALPDEAQAEVYRTAMEPHVQQGATLGFIHGFSTRYGLISARKDLGVVMVAPKGPGRTVRERFEEGVGLPCLFAVHQESLRGDAEAIGLAWARGIGCARAGIVYTTFADEAETDLFGEQAVLCGGMMELILAAFETLVARGYPPELAYLECCHEVKQIADLVYERGLAAMMEKISNTAEFGAHHAGARLIDDGVRERMTMLLDEIRDGRFAAALSSDYRAGFAWLNERREELRQHPIEAAGETVRSLMPWLGRAADATTSARGEGQASGRKDSR